MVDSAEAAQRRSVMLSDGPDRSAAANAAKVEVVVELSHASGSNNGDDFFPHVSATKLLEFSVFAPFPCVRPSLVDELRIKV